MSDALRVLYVSETGVLGGAGQSLLRLLEGLEGQVETDLAAPEGALAAAAAQVGVVTYPLPECRLRRSCNIFTQYRQLQRFLTYCRELSGVCELLRPDLVHANGPVAAWAAIRCSGRPVVWHVRDLRLPRRLMRLVRGKAAAVVAISRAVAKYIEAEAPAGAPIYMIHNGLAVRDFEMKRPRAEVRAEWGIPKGAPVVGCVGQTVPWKRHELALAAFAEVVKALPEARLVLIGGDSFNENGRYASDLCRLIEALGVKQAVKWIEHTDDPASALAAFDVLAHPAETEPFGRVVLEALAVGTPVVAVNTMGPAEIIEHGVSGYLVPPDDVVALAGDLLRVLQNYGQADKLRRGGLLRAEDFRQEKLTPLVLDVYHEAIAHANCD